MVNNSLNVSSLFSKTNRINPFNNPQDRPHIYVACLASYNSGLSHGRWLDATQNAETILTQIKQLLANSSIPNSEEFAIYDYQGFHSLRVGLRENIEAVCEKASFILKHGVLGAKLASYYGGSLEDATEALKNHYLGEYESQLAYAMHIFDECYGYDVPKIVLDYIDYEQFQRDIFIDDYFSIEVKGCHHIFICH